MTNRFTKIGADGTRLEANATAWAAILDATTGLTWAAAEPKPMTWETAIAWAKELALGGFAWRIPTFEELIMLADRNKHSPAIDKHYFPDCKCAWYWTSTPAAYMPSEGAWVVAFRSGHSFWAPKSASCFVRAVHSSLKHMH
jgi:Protein of unknown function (DUF1566)